MNGEAWALLAVSAVVIWGGLAASVVWLGRHREPAALFDDDEEETP